MTENYSILFNLLLLFYMWTKIFQETRETRQAIQEAIFTIRQRGNRFSIFCCVNRVIEIILGNSPTTLLLSSLRWILV